MEGLLHFKGQVVKRDKKEGAMKKVFVVAALITVILISAGTPAAAVDLSNACFEAEEQGPWYWWGDAGTGTYGASENIRNGKKSVKMVADKGDYVPLGFLQDFECKPGDEITISAWVMSPASSPLTNSDAFVRLEFWGTDQVNLIENYESPHLTGAFNWTKSSVSGKAPEGTIKAKIGLFIWNPGIGHSGTVYFDDAEVLKKALVAF